MSSYKRKYEESDRKGSESRRRWDQKEERRRDKDEEEKEEEEEKKERREKAGSDDGESKKPKMTFSIGAMKKPGMTVATSKPTLKAINIKLEPQKSQVSAVKSTLQSVFNSDSEEEEEMPPEAKMRMRNIGRETPTSAGPNSFGKTKQGFCNAQKVFEKNLKKAALEAGDTDK